MGLPAARAILDKGAHSAIILMGSLNVNINGFQAARQGDPIICPFHGGAVITKGSATVFINGLPAARMLDITGCGAPPPPPVVSPPAAPGGASGGSGGVDVNFTDDEKDSSGENSNETRRTQENTAFSHQGESGGVTVGNWKKEKVSYGGNGKSGNEKSWEATPLEYRNKKSIGNDDASAGASVDFKGPTFKANKKTVAYHGEDNKWGIEVGASGSVEYSAEAEGEGRVGDESVSVSKKLEKKIEGGADLKAIYDKKTGEFKVGVHYGKFTFEHGFDVDSIISPIASLLGMLIPIPPPIPGTVLSGSGSVFIGG